jgi:hypothetical protein
VWASIWLLILLPGTLELGLLIFAVLGYLSNPPFSVVSLDISSRDAIRLSRQAQVIAMVVKSNYRLPSPKVAGVAAIALTITILDALPAVAVCSNEFLIGEDLRGTIHSAAANQRTESPVGGRNANGPERKVGTVCAIFNELRRCWVPPPSSEARRGMEITVRFAFKRNGEIIAAPRVTYVSAGASPETRATYLKAIAAALDRCTPLNLTKGLASVIVGHPFAVRFVDDRSELSQ